jgi:hypothetical protein
MLLWLFLAVILVTAPPLLIVGWLQLQDFRKQGPLKVRQVIILIPVAFFAIYVLAIFVWTVATMLRQ